jgi:hypothetical protein
MTKHKPSATQQAAELRSIDLLPPAEARRRTDNLLRTLLNSPPDPFTPKAKPKKRAKK